ncbi:probable dolichyl pyrophosphate Glc1Man9GlcNAc2 alpha-1,3-glucosyltransferase isoform X1 [Salvia miltiorrhiza]|uniref:probable dolichyl pyrophosphate Glc1Man9GlcNAc2 alpha-1,3-glucosyltransferase isoform X1 n=1 Tax=Salvia miltiorrhiza TaxID=226208 RepID=UPI0025AC0704|nr:probable dolichyl pyrophosphate Glc1Man9GlcNAc2 alpha-1,3-glucosyltransferase isoform X1 [Salvia miltiorrhiza]
MTKPPNNCHYTGGVWWPALVAAAVKLLLIPAYHSTDFEVHRHWLALTHSLPLSRWYSDSTSQWTLDYPPFFAYFEKFLSIFAARVDPLMTDLYRGLDYASSRAILFQRLSVALSDVLLVYSAYRLTKKRNFRDLERLLICALVIWAPGLFLVDHMHFQYNGFLLGMLLLSISFLEEGRDLMGGFIFAVLLCFKHLFAVAAPVYFVYLFRHYCRGGFLKGFARLVLMGCVVLAVFAAAYLPFWHYGQIREVLQRMFPFGRGLCHAYWAPNFWVFYIMLDKVLGFLLMRLGFNVQAPKASFTGGLVGDSSPFSVLPTITPFITFITVLLAVSPCLIKAWRNPQPRMVSRWVSYAYTCGFLFGWHVHEKASLHFVIPLALTSLKSVEDAKHYFFLSIVSCYSLFPLLFEAQEYPIKVVLLLLHAVLMLFGFSAFFPKPSTTRDAAVVKGRDNNSESHAFRIGWLGKSYLVGLVVVEIWGQFLHPIIFGDALPFLPLMMISIYCALGMLYSWIWQLTQIVLTN